MLPLHVPANIKDLNVFFDSKLYFHKHVDFLFSEYINLLGLIRSITLRFSSLDSLYVLYFTLIRSKLEYASVVRNSITSTDVSKPEPIPQKFASVCFYCLSPHVPYSHTFALDKLSLYSLRKRRHHLDALFFVHVYRGLKSFTSLLENINLSVPTRNVRDFLRFSVCPSNKHCLSARCAYAANVMSKDLDRVSIGAVSVNHIV
jgi:hypothetical protein